MKFAQTIPILLLCASLSAARPVWRSFFNELKDQVQQYLIKFGYVHLYANENDVVDGIKTFQRYAQIPETGRADKETVDMMASPQCGDTRVATNSFSNSLYHVNLKWPKTNLTYSIQNFSPDMSSSLQTAVVRKALQMWAAVTPLKFTESKQADINIRWVKFDHGDDVEFDGPGQVLAHAFFPPSGVVHFDDSETFTTQSSRGINLDWVATHELGHALGLPHSSSKGAVMYPFYPGYNQNLKLTVEDVFRIQNLYGAQGRPAVG